jgi:hypothetical protein
MKRLHVHIAVENLAQSVRFYSALFAAEPTVSKPDYAKWMLNDPRVNFAISQRSATIGLNHLGVQVESSEELAEMHSRLQNLQSDLMEEAGTTCCYAKSDKYWVSDPQGIAWETFHTLDNIPVFGGELENEATTTGCCTPTTTASQVSATACCAPANDQKTKAGTCC